MSKNLLSFSIFQFPISQVCVSSTGSFSELLCPHTATTSTWLPPWFSIGPLRRRFEIPPVDWQMISLVILNSSHFFSFLPFLNIYLCNLSFYPSYHNYAISSAGCFDILWKDSVCSLLQVFCHLCLGPLLSFFTFPFCFWALGKGQTCSIHSEV